jgi:hypothetical protein
MASLEFLARCCRTMGNSSSAWSPRDPDAERHHIGRVDSLVVRPEIPWRRYLMFGTLLGGWTVLSGVGLALAISKYAIAALGCGAGVVALLLVGGLRLYLVHRFSTLRVDGIALTFVNGLGVSRTVARGSLRQVARASLDVTVRSSFTVSYYLFMGADGRAAFKLPAKWWPDTGIVGLATTLGLPVSGSFFEVLDGPGFRRTFPRSIPWVVAHPRLAACLIGLLTLPVLVVIMSVVVILQGKA